MFSSPPIYLPTLLFVINANTMSSRSLDTSLLSFLRSLSATSYVRRLQLWYDIYERRMWSDLPTTRWVIKTKTNAHTVAMPNWNRYTWSDVTWNLLNFIHGHVNSMYGRTMCLQRNICMWDDPETLVTFECHHPSASINRIMILICFFCCFGSNKQCDRCFEVYPILPINMLRRSEGRRRMCMHHIQECERVWLYLGDR